MKEPGDYQAYVENYHATARRVRALVYRICRVTFFVLCGLGILVLPCVLWLVGFALTIDQPFRTSVPNPGAEFSQETGLLWPADATIRRAGDDRGGIRGEGEFFVVFDTDRDTLDQWLSQPPPWRAAGWESGGVPGDVAQYCQFGGGESKSALTDPDVTYCMHCLRQGASYCTAGRLLAINKTTGRVYLSEWNW